MTLQSHRKLRTTLRRTFSNVISRTDNGLSVAALLISSGLALSCLTNFAQADGWQGRNSQVNTSVAVQTSADMVKPTITPVEAKSVISEIQPAVYDQDVNSVSPAVHRVSYTANDSSQNLRWANPSNGSQTVGVKTYRQTVRRTTTAPANTYAQAGASAYSDPFGDRTPRASAYGADQPVEVPSLPSLKPVPSIDTPPALEDIPNIELPDTPDAPLLNNNNSMEMPTIPAAQPTPIKPSTGAIDTSKKTFKAPLQPQDIVDSTMDDTQFTKEQNEGKLKENCPPVSSLKPISKITNDIAASDGAFPNECTLGNEPFEGRHFAPICYTWTAPALAVNPLYFEDPSLERYGHSWGTILQPIVSAGEFVVTIPALPWLMAIDPPNECQYTLGYYRPGECAPYIFDPIPFSVRAAVVEGGVATALIFLIP